MSQRVVRSYWAHTTCLTSDPTSVRTANITFKKPVAMCREYAGPKAPNATHDLQVVTPASLERCVAPEKGRRGL